MRIVPVIQHSMMYMLMLYCNGSLLADDNTHTNMSGILRTIRRTASRLSGWRRKRHSKRSRRNVELMVEPESAELKPQTTDNINENRHAIDSPDGTALSGDTTVEIHKPEADGSQDYTETNGSEMDGLDSSFDSESGKGKKKSSTKWNFRKKISDTLLHPDLEHCDPEICVELIRPSMKFLSSLKKKISHSKGEWIQGFLDCGGLGALFDIVDSVGSRRVNQLSDAMLLLECVACIKSVLNSRLGLDYLVQNGAYTKKLVKGKQIFLSYFKVYIYTNVRRANCVIQRLVPICQCGTKRVSKHQRFENKLYYLRMLSTHYRRTAVLTETCCCLSFLEFVKVYIESFLLKKCSEQHTYAHGGKSTESKTDTYCMYMYFIKHNKGRFVYVYQRYYGSQLSIYNLRNIMVHTMFCKYQQK